MKSKYFFKKYLKLVNGYGGINEYSQIDCDEVMRNGRIGSYGEMLSRQIDDDGERLNGQIDRDGERLNC